MQNMKDLPAKSFEFVQLDDHIHDTKFETKPVGYLKDAWNRFKKNKASVVAAIIIVLIVLYGIIYPFCTDRKLSENHVEFSLMRPKNDFLSNFGFCNGQYTKKGTLSSYAQDYGKAVMYLYTPDNVTTIFNISELEDLKFNPIKKINKTYETEGLKYIEYRIDQYLEKGYERVQVTRQEYAEMLKWQEETGYQLVFPLVDTSNYTNPMHKTNDDLWYMVDNKGYPLDKNGKAFKDIEKFEYLVPNFLTDSDGNVLYTQDAGTDSYYIRVSRYVRYIYDFGEEPSFLLGSDGIGYDIAVRLAYGIRLSLILAVCVAVINFIIGSIYGAIAGYYGGAVDMIMERITDVLGGMPTMVVITLFNIFLVETNKVSPAVSFIIAFIATGWIGTASGVRTQFYRFKHQEYVLAARTLGARDFRLMFKHVFPNSLGTIITSSVLVIPGVIFSETSLSYLGIIDLNGPNASSIGTMLSNGQQYLSTYPHIILWPAIIIALLMLCFNLFGNGLRDAFNPSLRGVEE